MDPKRICAVGTFAVAGLALLTGCPSIDPKFTNQGGGSLLSAIGKVLGSNIGSITADEIQLTVDAVGNFNPRFNTEVTDEQAAAGVDFIEANNIESIADIEALVEQAEQDPGSVVIPESIQALIEAGNIPT